MGRTVAIVPHTHWDREWYSSFQTFRLRLVDLLDEFLPLLERDPAYARFLLDGQMAVIDDYLEIRPEAEAVLRRLAASGRLTMGPWYILMDEFLVSAETIVRDLQLGFERATSFGGAMEVGYLPDMFGHIAQMPQILRQAGIEHAVVWRGVPAAINRTAFNWSAPDGSTVRAEYLRYGYGNGAAMPNDAKALLARIRDHVDELGTALGPDDGVLWMNGTDHEVPQPWLGRVVAEVNDIQDDFTLAVTSLAEYLDAAPSSGLPAWQGELRSGARSNLLMGVASNRVDVKQAAARTERMLERIAEPLCALFLPAEKWPGGLLDVAWREVIRNAAHDSICACSHDDVGRAVLHRFAEAFHIADGLRSRAVRQLASELEGNGPVVVNSSPRTRAGIVEINVPGEGPIPGGQIVRERQGVRAEFNVVGRELGAILGQIRSQQFDEDTYINSIDIDETDEGLDVVLHADSRLRSNLVVEEIKRDLYARVGARPDMAVRVRVVEPPSRRVVVRVPDVPGYGWKRWQPQPLNVLPVTAEGGRLANGLLTIDADAATGTFSINGQPGFDRLVDDGDHGDTYNYSPPDTDVAIDEPESVNIDIVESGPVRARLRVERNFVWPSRISDKRRARVGEVNAKVTTIIELRAGERLVHVHHQLVNPARDHRLRAWFPLPTRADRSEAECAFAIVTRGTTAEGGPHERAMTTFPSRRFVRAGGLTVVHEGLLEYELVDGGRSLALTLLRATGMLSRVDMTYRPLPAGPPIRLEGPQMLGPVEARYSLHLGEGDPFALVDDAFMPLHVATAPGGGRRPDAGTALTVDGAEVSAVRRVAGGLELRVFNPQPASSDVSFDGRRGWRVDLRGRPIETFDGSLTLQPWGIATVRLGDSQ